MTRFVRLLFAAALAASILVGVSSGSYAAVPADTIAKFTTDDIDDMEAGIAALVSSGDPMAERILQALRDEQLLYDADAKSLYIQDSGALIDAATGQRAVNPPADLPSVTLTNRLRRAVDAAFGSLNLLSPDAGKRIDAAQSVFKAREASALPIIDEALKKETDSTAKRAFAEARASILLASPDASDSDKINAIAVLKARGDQDSLAMLSDLPDDTSPAVRSSAATAVASVQRSLAIWSAVQNLWYGVSLSSVLLLAAIGLAITFGVMGVINMAHGEMVMIGAYTTYVVQETVRASYPALSDYSLPISVPMAFIVAGAVGIAIERTCIRFLYGRSLETLLATWGISLIIQQAVRTIFGTTNREVSSPSWMSGGFDIGQISITYGRLWIVLFTISVFLMLIAMLRYTSLGLEMRAVTQNRRMAASMGIATSRVDALTFGLGSGIAGIAGVALSQIDNVSPNLGQSYIIDSFMVVVFGGVGNLWGTLVGAFTLGIANKFLEPVAGAVLGKIAILVLIILFIQKRPRGLFALKGRAVEA
jgi:urea transport system permease protein